ncbi:hypothetical protein F5146DRAFT_1047050 [Armillaria mellea]|nr:hypothetical protein F5146DRAFT_1047050 [Armillaria mellea]
MFAALDIDIRPGIGLGIFEIGSSLWTILDMLRRMQTTFPQIDIKYDPDSSSTTPIVLHLRPHLDLLFSGKHQRLRTICLRKLRDPNPPLTLRYKDASISSSEEVLRKVDVRRFFGPTYPGDDLRYPGLWFSFDEDGIAEGIKGVQSDDKMQEVKRVFISQKDANKDQVDALDEVEECSTMDGDVALAVVKVKDGVTLHFHPLGSKTLHIQIGQTTAQDLNIGLGPPLRVHYKEDERMSIHSCNQGSDLGTETGYFYNYFQHGLDFLISSTSHVVQKIVIHTNIPGTPLFQRYKRCNWEIESSPEDDEDDTPPRKRFYDRFETISHFLSPHETPPSMLLDRTDDEESITLPSSTTRLHGYEGIILEVTESSQVVSVMLF